MKALLVIGGMSGATFAAPFMLTTAIINETSLVPVGAAIACCIFIGAGLWKVATAFQKITDTLEMLTSRLTKQEDKCEMRHRQDDPARVDEREGYPQDPRR